MPIGLAVDGVNRHDSKLVQETLKSILFLRPPATRRNPQGLCLEKGHDNGAVRLLVEMFGYTTHIKARGQEA